MFRTASGRKTGVKNGKPMMWSQCRCVSRIDALYGVERPRAEVEDHRLVAVGFEGDARGVPAVSRVALAVARRGAANSVEGELDSRWHGRSGYPLFAWGETSPQVRTRLRNPLMPSQVKRIANPMSAP